MLAYSYTTALFAPRAPTAVRTPTACHAVRALLHPGLARPVVPRGSLPLRALLGQLLSRCIRLLCIADIWHVYPDAQPPNRRHHLRANRSARQRHHIFRSCKKSLVTQDNNARNYTREALCDSPVATQSSFSRLRPRPRPVRCTRRCPSRCPTASPSRPTDVAPTPGRHHQRFLNLTGARTSSASPAARVVALRFLARPRRRRLRLHPPGLHPRPRPHRRPPSRSTFMPSSASEDASS